MVFAKRTGAEDTLEKLSQGARAIYAELVESLLGEREDPSPVTGGFVRKRIGGGTFWYHQVRLPGGKRVQTYLGPASDALDRLMAQARPQAGDEEDRAAIRDACAMLQAAGLAYADAAESRVMRMLADAGVFAFGGVLLGTHAFVALCYLLGVRAPEAKTAGAEIELAFPGELPPVPPVLERIEQGFSPVCGLSSQRASTRLTIYKKTVRVKLFTARRHDEPVLIEPFAAMAEPAPYLDFVLERPQPAAFVAKGARLVAVPQAPRFALYRLVTAKSPAEIEQAGYLLALSSKESLRAARAAFEAQGPSVRKLTREGLQMLSAQRPELGRRARAALG